MTRTWRQVPGYAFLTVVALVSVFPLYFMVVSATNTSQDVLGSRLFPGANLLANLRDLLGQQDVGAAMWHSVVNAVGTTVVALVICSIAGYGFEIYHTRGKDRLMGFLLLAIMIPFAATMIPLFQMFAEFGWVNSTTAVVLPAISTPFLILLFRQSARSFPHEILEAVWAAAPQGGRERILLRGCIQIANANLKLRMAKPHAAQRLFTEALTELKELGVRQAGAGGSGFADSFPVAALTARVAGRLAQRSLGEADWLTIGDSR